MNLDPDFTAQYYVHYQKIYLSFVPKPELKTLSYVSFRFKVHHALQQAIEQSRDSIILIFLHNIQDYKLNHALCLRRGMFRSCCILKWPAQKERVNAFHQQLVMALKSNSKAR